MAGDEGSRALAELEARGLAVVRGSCGPEAATRAAAEVHGALERMLRLPTTMAERARAEGADAASPPRHFVPFATEPGAAAEVEAEHRRDFRAPLTGGLEAALREALNGPAGAAVAGALGGRAERVELRELLGIVSEPGAAAQALHADGAWGPASPRVVTLFLALVDATDENAGPTFFVPGTHAPRCFPDGRWRPPAGAGGDDGALGVETWFPLAAGDLVAMDALCWHRGGANTSAAVRRTLLCASFAPRERGSGNPALARFRGRAAPT